MREDPFFEYQLIVTGVSILKSRGEDINIIKADGFNISKVVKMFNENGDDTGAEMTRAYGRVMEGLSDAFEELRPDLILAGFDIGANFVAATVGAHMNIPIAHIQGGEVTGSIDESLRHATTKFAHIHFPATALAAQRLIRMGEDERYVFTVGCPSIDTICQAPIMSRDEIYHLINLDPSTPYVLIVQHPVTTEMQYANTQMIETLRGVKDAGVAAVIIYPNNDAGSSGIVHEIENSAFSLFKGFAPHTYVNVLRYAAALVGNSSSGIHETATLRIPTVNIGSRQNRRERCDNVLDVAHDREQIAEAVKKAVFSREFIETARNANNIYGDGKSASRIVNILKDIDYSKVPIQKQFID